jgi:hypothetical protein
VVVHGRVEQVRNDGEGVAVRVAGWERPLRARFAVLATGADVSLLDDLGMLEEPAPTAVAVRAYVRSRAPLEALVISFDREIVPCTHGPSRFRTMTVNVAEMRSGGSSNAMVEHRGCGRADLDDVPVHG